MLTALILVCSLAITPELRNCDRNNALQVLQVPEQFGTPRQGRLKFADWKVCAHGRP